MAGMGSIYGSSGSPRKPKAKGGAGNRRLQRKVTKLQTRLTKRYGRQGKG